MLGKDTLKPILLFVAAVFAEIGGAWLVWQGVREHKGWMWVGAGVIALGLYGFVATLQPDAHFGRILPPAAGSSWPAPSSGRWSPTGSSPTGTTLSGR